MSVTFYQNPSQSSSQSPIEPNGPEDVNFCNANAYQLLAVMGIEPAPYGEMPAAEFNHLAWQAWSLPDADLIPHVRATVQEDNFIYFGSDISSIRERLLRVAALGNQGTIVWC